MDKTKISSFITEIFSDSSLENIKQKTESFKSTYDLKEDKDKEFLNKELSKAYRMKFQEKMVKIIY